MRLCTIKIVVYEAEDAENTYYVDGYGNWRGYKDTDSKEYPALGDDCIGFIWGGEYNYKDHGINRYYQNVKKSSDTKWDVGEYRNVMGEPSKSRGWAFPDKISSNRKLWRLRSVNGWLTLYKNSLDGGDTKLYFKYIHTYKDLEYSFGFSVDPTASALYVTPTEKSWSDFVEVTIKK